MKTIDVRVDSDVDKVAKAIEAYRDNGIDTLIRAYKFVTKDYKSPYPLWPSWPINCRRPDPVGPIYYELGSMQEVDSADTNEFFECGAGINVASLDFCTMRMNWPSYGDADICKRMKYIALEFKASDVAVVPKAYGYNHKKFRLHRCKVVGEVDAHGKLIAWAWKGKIARRKK